MVFGEVHSSLVSSPLDYSTDPKKKKRSQSGKGTRSIGAQWIQNGPDHAKLHTSAKYIFDNGFQTKNIMWNAFYFM